MYPTQIVRKTAQLVKGTLKHPLASPPPTGAAFSLVRQVLRERPKHFHQIFQDGLKALESDFPPVVKEEEVVKTKKNGWKDHSKRQVVHPRPRRDGLAAPDGHPFVSGSFLKKRILTILESQNLIKKEWHVPEPAPGKAAKDKKQSMFRLNEEGNARERWEKMSQPDVGMSVMSSVGGEVQREKREMARQAKERRHDAGEPRTEREIMAWENRPAGMTTNLERIHLNVRRRRARDAKEQRASKVANERAAAREAAQAAITGPQ